MATILLAYHGTHTITAEEMADGTLDEWTHRNHDGDVMGWSSVGNRKAASSTLLLFFSQARRQSFDAFTPSKDGRWHAVHNCNCNPDRLPVTWKRKRKPPPPPQDRKGGRGSNDAGEPRNAKEWSSYCYRLGNDLELPGAFKAAKSLGDVAHIIRAIEIAKELQQTAAALESFKAAKPEELAGLIHALESARTDAILDRAHAWDEARRQRRAEAAWRRALGEPALPRAPKMDEATRKAKKSAADKARRDAAKIERALEQAKRDRTNEKRRAARAAKKRKG